MASIPDVRLAVASPPTTHPGRPPAPPRVPPRIGDQVLARVADVFPGLAHLDGRLAPRSLREYVYNAHLYVAFVNNPAAVLDPASLRRWRQYMVLHTRLSPKTINIRLVAVKSLIKASAACGAVPGSLAHDFQLVERVKTAPLRDRLKRSTRTLLTPEQVRALCRAPDASTLIGLRDRAFLFTLASSGARVSEVVGLRREDLVRTDEGWALRLLGKGEAYRRLAPLTAEAHTWLRRWICARDQQVYTRWVFTAVGPHAHARAEPLTRQGAYQLTKRYTAQITLGHISPHHLRRFVGTQVAARAGIREAQKTLGHRLLQTTIEHYVLDAVCTTVTEGLF